MATGISTPSKMMATNVNTAHSHQMDVLAPKLLRELGIDEVSSFNFGMKDLLNISKSTLEWEKPVTLKEKLLYIASKFIMLDRSPYNMSLNITVKDQTENSSYEPINDKEHNIESEFYAMFDDQIDNSSQKMTNVLHPSDAIVILLNCCDTFVRQVMIQKMRTCQLAVPLILPDIINEKQLFLLWPMRHLVLNWKTKSQNSQRPKLSAQECNPVDVGLPIISAIKLGNLSNSKSKILNSILCTEAHDIFFHKHCDEGQLPRKIANGVVELAWYLPGGKDKDTFEESWTLANLRGDARKHEKQFNLLKQVSPIMLVFISLESFAERDVQSLLKQFSNSNHHLIFVFLDPVNPITNEEKKRCQGIFIKMFSTLMQAKKCFFVAESDGKQGRNEAKLKNEIQAKIRQSLQSVRSGCIRTFLNLEDISRQAHTIGITIDESNDYCQKGKALANGIIEQLLCTEAEDRKKKELPLQGIFQTLSEYSKQLHRKEDVDFNKMCSKMQQCRKEQFDKVKQMTPAIKGFIKIVTDKENIKIRMYFLQWMKIYLEAQSKLYLNGEEKKYHAMWNNVQNKKLSDTKELEEIEKNLDNLSFGLEHFFREIGQVYEAIRDEERNTEFEELADNLSTFAADILINGYPLEMLNGDASHLPLDWIRAVLERIKDRLGDKKIYVISVLGLQSSGKSTLLNTMFGLSFSVSAGRCTKGVFAQLISVQRDLHCELGYEYILVLDTEGLRAMELGSNMCKHDNELASFIVGMGDITIVNNKGENAAEIGDVMQICVHAFLRMRLANNNINLQPGCYFAHQNVPDVNADSKMLYGFKRLKDQLDDIATTAAKHENVVGQINSFSDVIKFDVNKQIWNFPNLWVGDPPMAPANPGYSDTVLKLKTDILRYPDKDSSLTFTDLQEHMIDLWKAILKENFVFSFKNSKEVRCYSLLEEKILAVSREFHNKVKTEMHKYTNRIDSCKSDFSNLKQKLLAELGNYIGQCQASYKKDLDYYFTSSSDKGTIIQWKNFASRKLEEIILDLKNEEVTNISNIIELRKASYENLKEVDNYKDDIERFVKEILANESPLQTSNVVLDKKFEEEWEIFIKGLHFPEIKAKKNIREEVMKFLRDQYNRHNAIVDSIHYTSKVIIDDADIDMAGLLDVVGEKALKGIYAKEKNDILIAIDNFSHGFLQIIEDYLNEIEEQDYESHFLLKIKEKFNSQLNSFSIKHDKYRLSKIYEVKMISHVLLSSIPHFEKMQTEYREKNDQKSMFNKMYKRKSYNIFIGTYTQCSKEITAAKILGDSLEPALLESMKREISEQISNMMMANKTEFQSKVKLIIKVLKDLKEKGEYTDYLFHINHPDRSFETWIKKYVNDYCTDKQNTQMNILGLEANKLFKNKLEVVVNCIETVSLNFESDFETWISEFTNAVNEDGTISLKSRFLSIFDMIKSEVKSIDNFKDEMIKHLENIQVKNEKVFETWGTYELLNLKPKPHKAIMKSLLGCMERCPFCKVICSCTFTHTAHDKKHSSRYHYPSGIAGYQLSETKELDIMSCNENIGSEMTFRSPATKGKSFKYKDYKSVNTYYSSWDIQDDRDSEALVYWKWVFGKFSKDFAESYGAEVNEIPSEWINLSTNAVETSIEKL